MVKVLEGWNLAFTPWYQLVWDDSFFCKEPPFLVLTLQVFGFFGFEQVLGSSHFFARESSGYQNK
jgi:hypothetical protein